MTNILVFPCGSEIGLEIHNALSHVKSISLFGASSVDDHGRFVYLNYDRISAFVGSENFFDEIRSLVGKHNIDFIYPAFDTVIEALSIATPEQLGGAEVLGSVPATNFVCRYKSKTYEALAGFDFVPRVYQLDTVVETDFPIFLKPDSGYGSRGIAVASTREDLARYLETDSELIAVEMLPGKEYTVDCFTDRHGSLRFIGPRVRARIKSGIAVASTTVALTAEIDRIAKGINATLELRGQWFFQVKEADDGSLKLLEVGPRVGGTMNLYRNRGVNLPLLTVLDRLGMDVEILDNGFEASVDRALVSRHALGISYSSVYVDFDDTLVVNGRVNVRVLSFLYQSKQDGKQITLLTRHDGDIRESLSNYAISEQLFSEIIHLTDGSPKSASIAVSDAVFIDDSFRERSEVLNAVGAAVFDLDAIESLLDWRL